MVGGDVVGHDVVRVLAACALILALGVLTGNGIDYRPPAVDDAIAATVILKGPDGEEVGCGFFVHPDGLLLTHADLVSPGRALQVVVDTDTEPQELDAAAVVIDQRRDLALLQVDHKPQIWLNIVEKRDNRLDDTVWFIGSIRKSKPKEESEIKGKIIEIHQDSGNNTIAIETNISTGTWQTGGPVLDLNGDVVGVIKGEVREGSRVGTAVSAFLLHQFSFAREASITFEPYKVLSPPVPIEVEIEPLLTKLEGSTGTVSFTGSDVEPIEIQLESDGTSWRGTIPVPTRIPGEPRPDSYTVDIRFVADSHMVFGRRFHFKVEKAPVATRRDDGSLSAIARNVRIIAKRDTVIDHEALSWYNSAMASDYPPERYDQLTSAEHEELATVFDMLQYGIDFCRKNLPELQTDLESFQEELAEVTPQLQRLDMIFCRDDEKWYYRQDATCNDILEP